MLFQTVRRNLHVKLFFCALFIISLTAIYFGSIKSFAQSNDDAGNRLENSIIAESKAEKRRPQMEASRRLPSRISRESRPVLESARTNDFIEILTSGDSEPTFGAGDNVTTSIGVSASEAFAVVLQPDGKFIAAGYSTNAADRDFALVRYHSDLTPDVSFGAGGKVTTDIGNDHNEILAAALQTDGKIIAAGYSSNGANDDFTLARYNPNGTLDSTFGTGGIVRTNFNNSFDYSEAVLIQPDGKIVAAGYSFNGSFFDFALARYNPDGTPDASFDGDGMLTTDFAGGDDLAFSLALQTDGKLVAAGVTGTDFGLARYNPNGSLDQAFDEDGKVSTSINNFDAAYAAAIQADGKIVAAGETDAGTNSDFVLVRYNSDGSLDTSFDADGKVTTAFGGGNEFAEALVIQTNGKLIAAGHSFNAAGNADFALVRYNADGSLDSTFGTGGKITTNFGNSANDFATALALQPSSNRLIAVGSSGLYFASAVYALETPTCSYSLNPTSAEIPATGGGGTFLVTTGSGCNWVATPSDSWITVTGIGIGTGSFTVTFSVQPNTGPARTGKITVGGQIFTINQASGCSYMLSASSQNFPASGGSGGNFNVSTNAGCTWTAQSNDNWITVTGGNSGNGNGAVSFTVAANTGPARTGTITVAGLTFTVNQASGCAYSLSATSANFAAAGGNGSVNVTAGSGCAWTAASNVNWISVTGGASGSGNGAVTYNVQANTGPARTGTLTIAGQTYTVTQAGGCTFSINPTGTTIPAAGGSGSFNVTASNSACGWTAAMNDAWISITSGSGTGSGAVSFTVQANPGPQRTGSITVGGQTFTITQTGGCSYSLSSNSANFPNTGGTGNFTINTTAGCQWTAVSNVSWITVTGGASGGRNGTISYSVLPNAGIARTGTITAGGQTFTVNQASGCTYAINPSSQNFSASGGSGSFAVTSSDGSCPWSSTGNVSWITITGGSTGGGNGTVTFTVAANTGAARTGTITAGGQTFTVNQAAAVITRSRFDYDGDGKADLSVFRPSAGSWYLSHSSNNAFIAVQFGANGDLIAPADFDGDGKTDISVFRPSDGGWYRLNSSNNTFSAFQFGA
ncbi:MAG TPA: BACON domain-containing carbohydrate-binding protein, partial [Pyrinomonadaceae bacterium]